MDRHVTYWLQSGFFLGIFVGSIVLRCARGIQIVTAWGDVVFLGLLLLLSTRSALSAQIVRRYGWLIDLENDIAGMGVRKRVKRKKERA